jgi:hypothetical protein
MHAAKPATPYKKRYSTREWDEIRGAFSVSIMVDTSLLNLSQNLDGPEWPIKDKKETPATYIDLTYSEAHEVLVSKGLAMESFDRLMDILKETLAFDNPFGDMVAQAEETAERDNPLLKNMARLEIPETFPIEFTALQENTLEFCTLEKLTTLGQFAVFAQGLSQAVIVGGDFRGLLNALSHVDEAALAKFIPFRPGAKGVHLVEAVALTVRVLPADQRAALGNKAAPSTVATQDRVSRLVAYFAEQKTALTAQLASGTALTRILVVLGDPALEALVGSLLQPHLRVAPTVATRDLKPAKPRGFFARLFGRT